jgi:hypothetical protein
MKWYHFTVEYFEDLRNVDHCEFLIMRHQENGKYLLETKLRTWSELRKERALTNGKDKGEVTANNTNGSKDDKEGVKIDRSRTVIVTRKWGGCPNGCNHASHYSKRHDLEALRQKDIERSSPDASNGGAPSSGRRHRHKSNVSVGDGDDEQSDQHLQFPKTQSPGEMPPSLDGTMGFPVADRARHLRPSLLHIGRDFGGTYSGHASLAGSDADLSSSDEHRPPTRPKSTHGGRRSHVHDETSDSSSMNPVAACANRLGDAPASIDTLSDEEDLDKAEAEDRSIRGSVY